MEVLQKTSLLNDLMKKAMLQNTVSGIKEFQDVKTTDQMEVSRGNRPINYSKIWHVVAKRCSNI